MNRLKSLLLAALENYPTIYISVDIHGTILEPTWNKNSKTYNYYPFALECLQEFSKNPRIKLIIWSASYPDRLEEYLHHFQELGINFKWINSNPECKDGEFSCFSRGKFYSDLILDDKAGFNPLEDWQDLLRTYQDYLRNP